MHRSSNLSLVALEVVVLKALVAVWQMAAEKVVLTQIVIRRANNKQLTARWPVV